MEDVELKLIANNSQAVKAVRELATESNKLYTNNEKNQKRQVGLIADIEHELGKLQTAQKNAMSIEAIEKYNQKIAEAKAALQEYEQAGVKATGNIKASGDTMMQSIGKWALGIGVVTTVFNALKSAVMNLTVAIDAVNVVGAVYKQVMYNMLSANRSWMQGVVEAIKIQNQFNTLRFEGYKEGVEVQKQETIYQQKYAAAISEVTDKKKKLILIDEALAAHNKAIDIQQEHAIKTRDAYLRLNLNQQGDEESVKGYYAAVQELERLDAERVSSAKRLLMQRANIIKDDHDKSIKAWHDEIEAQNKLDQEQYDAKLKLEEQYQAAANAIIDRYNKLNVDSLTGVDKLKAQRDFALNEIDILKTHLVNFGPLSENQQNMILKLVDDVQKVFIKGMEKEAKYTPAQKDAISKALLKNMPTLEGLRPDKTQKAFKKDTTSIWELFGIDPESDEGKAAIEGITKAYNTTVKMLDDTFKKRVEDTQRRRELLDTQVSEAQSALNTEVDLYKAGYASNVAGKKKELADLKIQRDLALKKEEEALKKQRQFDAIQQASSLITASADIFKSLAKIPVVGIPLAIVAIGAMFAAFAAARVEANKASKLAYGGHGEVTGRLHSQGGERFLDHIEVEQGERWGVLNRSASRKYGPVFNKMVDSFNKGNLPIPKEMNINNITVQNEGPNKRLDEVNRNLTKMSNREEVTVLGNMTIYKKGNSTRIIRR